MEMVRGPDGFGITRSFTQEEDTAMKKRRRGPVETPGLDVLGPLQEIIRQVRKGDLTVAHLQAVAMHRNPFARAETVKAVELAELFTIADAVSILGEGKVLTAAQAAKAQGREAPEDAPIRWSEETLRLRAGSNGRGETDWRVVYEFGASLRESREQFGTDRNCQPCFHKENTWWFRSAEDEWAKFRPDGRYYLIDLNGRFDMLNWQRQEERIRKLGPQFRRAHEAVITEAAFLIFKVTGERLLETWYHWGRSLDSLGNRVLVGDFCPGGWHVGGRSPGWDDDTDLRVCLEEVPTEA